MIPRTRIDVGIEEFKAILSCIVSNGVVIGPDIQRFETNLKDYLGVELLRTLKNGRSAIWIALKSIAKNREEVVIPAYSCTVIADAIKVAGFKPVFCDVDKRTYNMDPEKAKEVVTKKTAAVMPINFFGQSAELKRLIEIAHDKKAILIEDNAQALGAEYQGKKTGTFGDFSIFSFGISKNINGWGGAIRYNEEFRKTTEKIIHKFRLPSYFEVMNKQISLFSYRMLSNPHIYPLIRKMTFKKGIDLKKYTNYHTLMSNIESSIGNIQLKKLDQMNKTRIQNAKKITHEANKKEMFEAPHITNNSKHVFLRYVIKLKGMSQREAIRKFLRKGIEAGLQREDYPSLIEKKEQMKFPVARELSRTLITLPIDPIINNKEMEKIKNAIRNIKYGKNKKTF